MLAVTVLEVTQPQDEQRCSMHEHGLILLAPTVADKFAKGKNKTASAHPELKMAEQDRSMGTPEHCIQHARWLIKSPVELEGGC